MCCGVGGGQVFEVFRKKVGRMEWDILCEFFSLVLGKGSFFSLVLGERDLFFIFFFFFLVLIKRILFFSLFYETIFIIIIY